MITQRQFCLIGFLLALPALNLVAGSSVDLSGVWGVRLDPENRGRAENWFSQSFEETLILPGCLQAQGYGERPGPDTTWWAPLDLSLRNPCMAKYSHVDENFKLIQYLMPQHHYIGKAWYSREIEIPGSFAGKRITLSLERCHWKSTVWVDGLELGSTDSLRYRTCMISVGFRRENTGSRSVSTMGISMIWAHSRTACRIRRREPGTGSSEQLH